jgi:hypothetical protein
LQQLVVIPGTSGEYWDWLSPTPELIDYIKWRFQNMGAFTLANGLFILGVSLTGLRQRERWAWAVLVIIPIYILFLTGIFHWLFFITIPLALLASWSLGSCYGELVPVVSKRRQAGWGIVFIVGLLLVYFAYDAFFIIPALDVRDPERGWDWLTTDPAHIQYIKLYFRVYGIHVFTFSMMTLLTVVFGLREGYPPAWKILWLVPLLIIVHVFIWPWLMPILIGVALLAGIGLGLSYPKALGDQNEEKSSFRQV